MDRVISMEMTALELSQIISFFTGAITGIAFVIACASTSR